MAKTKPTETEDQKIPKVTRAPQSNQIKKKKMDQLPLEIGNLKVNSEAMKKRLQKSFNITPFTTEESETIDLLDDPLKNESKKKSKECDSVNLLDLELIDVKPIKVTKDPREKSELPAKAKVSSQKECLNEISRSSTEILEIPKSIPEKLRIRKNFRTNLTIAKSHPKLVEVDKLQKNQTTVKIPKISFQKFKMSEVIEVDKKSRNLENSTKAEILSIEVIEKAKADNEYLGSEDGSNYNGSSFDYEEESENWNKVKVIPSNIKRHTTFGDVKKEASSKIPNKSSEYVHRTLKINKKPIVLCRENSPLVVRKNANSNSNQLVQVAKRPNKKLVVKSKNFETSQTFLDLETLDSFCRICCELKEQNELNSLNSTWNQNGTTVKELIQYVSNLTIDENDGLPRKVCNDCFDKMVASYSVAENMGEEDHVETENAEDFLYINGEDGTVQVVNAQDVMFEIIENLGESQSVQIESADGGSEERHLDEEELDCRELEEGDWESRDETMLENHEEKLNSNEIEEQGSCDITHNTNSAAETNSTGGERVEIEKEVENTVCEEQHDVAGVHHELKDSENKEACSNVESVMEGSENPTQVFQNISDNIDAEFQDVQIENDASVRNYEVNKGENQQMQTENQVNIKTEEYNHQNVEIGSYVVEFEENFGGNHQTTEEYQDENSNDNPAVNAANSTENLKSSENSLEVMKDLIEKFSTSESPENVIELMMVLLQTLQKKLSTNKNDTTTSAIKQQKSPVKVIQEVQRKSSSVFQRILSEKENGSGSDFSGQTKIVERSRNRDHLDNESILSRKLIVHGKPEHYYSSSFTGKQRKKHPGYYYRDIDSSSESTDEEEIERIKLSRRLMRQSLELKANRKYYRNPLSYQFLGHSSKDHPKSISREMYKQLKRKAGKRKFYRENYFDDEVLSEDEIFEESDSNSSQSIFAKVPRNSDAQKAKLRKIDECQEKPENSQFSRRTQRNPSTSSSIYKMIDYSPHTSEQEDEEIDSENLEYNEHEVETSDSFVTSTEQRTNESTENLDCKICGIILKSDYSLKLHIENVHCRKGDKRHEGNFIFNVLLLNENFNNSVFPVELICQCGKQSINENDFRQHQRVCQIFKSFLSQL